MQRRVLAILFGVLFIVMMGFSVLFPVEAYYIQTFGATARTMGWLMASFSLSQFIFSPIWGRLSDRVGRKPVMMLGLFGYAAGMTLFGLARSIPGLFASRILAGILSSATLPTAMAVIADTTSSDDRARGMGILGAAFGLGIIFGPFIGGVLGSVHITYPFFLASTLSVLTLVVVATVLPESLPPEQRRAPRAAAPGSRWAALNRITTPLYGLAFVVTLSLAGLETAFPFLADDRLGLTQRTVGYMYAIMGLVGATVQGGLVGRLKRLLGEERMIVAGLVASALGMAGIAIAPSPVTATVGLSIFAVGHGLIRPANAALITQRAGVGHGLAIGLLDAMDSLGRTMGPVIGGLLYSYRDALPFVSGATLNLAAVVLFTVTVLSAVRRRPQPQEP